MTKTSPFMTALRAALTLAFLYFGLRKLGSFNTDVAIYEAIGFGQFPRYITGSIEIIGAGLLWWRRRRSPFLFGEYVALNGLGRLFIEHWRINPRVALGLTEPQWIGIALVLLGGAGWFYYARVSAAAPPQGPGAR